MTVTTGMVQQFRTTFLNRPEYNIQSRTPDGKGRYGYYLSKIHPNGPLNSLNDRAIQEHLEGLHTIALFAQAPNNTCKWIAIDADYQDAIRDLLRLQAAFQRIGVTALLEHSRRGGHLWIFAATPLPAPDCRTLVYHYAGRLDIPIMGILKPAGTAHPHGLEIYPRYNRLSAEQRGPAIRAPFGVHRAVKQRFWFGAAAPSLKAQLELLRTTPRLTLEQLRCRTASIDRHPSLVEEDRPPGAIHAAQHTTGDTIFRITDFISVSEAPIVSGNWVVRCPSCAEQGRDRAGDNLHIKVSEPLKYICRNQCTADQIRAALGYRPRLRNGSVLSV